MCVCFGAMIQTLFRCDEFLIIDKPAGLAVQPGEGVRVSVIDVLERDFGFKPYLVHRLDKETAGCLVVARSPADAARLAVMLGSGARKTFRAPGRSSVLLGSGARKTYRALVAGRPEPAVGVLKDEVRIRGKSMSAETRYRRLDTDERLSLVEAELGTGRMHQIRQHFAMAGHPIIGDDKYGDFRLNRQLGKELGIRRLMLYAARLYLPLEPPVEAVASVPPHFAAFFERWGRGEAV